MADQDIFPDGFNAGTVFGPATFVLVLDAAGFNPVVVFDSANIKLYLNPTGFRIIPAIASPQLWYIVNPTGFNPFCVFSNVRIVYPRTQTATQFLSYPVVLTGDMDGKSDLDLSYLVTEIQITTNISGQCIAQVVLASLELASEIALRPNGDLIFYSKLETNGQKTTGFGDELARVTFNSFNFSATPLETFCSLNGSGTIIWDCNRTFSLDSVLDIENQTCKKVITSNKLLWSILPGDTCEYIVNEQQDSFVIGEMKTQVSTEKTFTTIKST